MTPAEPALRAALPEPVRERVRPMGGTGAPRGEFVLYWMRTAVRGHENPALDAALGAADVLGLPVFVYHGLTERYPYASDRHHTFILQGARAVAEELRARGVGYALHVERPGHRGPHLRTLARRAALVVTEDQPVPPLRDWLERLSASLDVPTWAVDTACVVPMNLVSRAHDRAFRFRDATLRLRQERLSRPWQDAPVQRPGFVPDLPFEPVDLRVVDIPELVAAATIDHTVAPVLDTPGGSRAGYARFKAFLAGGLKGYARRRNDPTLSGTSRMSAYLHYGHVSPLRVAREAAAVGGAGAEKFLDELLIWRELAHRWCRDQPDLHDVQVLPDWARETLREHQGDARPALPSWESLARAKTGDRLWDACQRSLRVHGELHNNVRMTWGKALIEWTPDAASALSALIDLNHRYALDGRDPASYGGLLWCLGAFDRPFDPPEPVTGRVRPRPLRSHAARLDLDAYEAVVDRPRGLTRRRVLVVGGGVAGLVCARTLADHGCAVEVLDKGRGFGGRLSTRRGDGVQWDHGCPAFTARTGLVRRSLRSWQQDGVVAVWEGRRGVVQDGTIARDEDAQAWWVGVPSSSSVVAHLGRGLAVRHQAQVASVVRDGSGWRALDGEGRVLGEAEEVVIAVPAPQAVPLLSAAPALAARLQRVEVGAVWTVMLRSSLPSPLSWDDLAFVHGPLARATRQPGRPGRGPAEAWVLHATTAWSQAHLDHDPDTVRQGLLDAWGAVDPGAVAVDTGVHRWRYGRVLTPVGEPCLHDPALGLGVAGDGLLGDGFESAFLSGAALAGRMLAR